jgi:hypothetical protein
VSKLTLNHDQRNALVRHLDRVGVSQLVRRESTSHTRRGSRVMQLLARRRRFPTSAGSRSMDHAQQCADRQLAADLQPWVELLLIPKSE